MLNFARRRIADKQVPALIKGDPDRQRQAAAGMPELQHRQAPGGVRWPLVPNIALSVLDEHSCAEDEHSQQHWESDAHKYVS